MAPPGRARDRSRARSAPTPGGKPLGRVGRKTEFGGPRFLGVTGRREGWLRIVIPERENGEHAWIRAEKATAVRHGRLVHIDRSERRLTVRDGDRAVLRVPVAVGRAEHPTPVGRYAVTDKLEMGGPGTTYGCCALALTGHQTDLPSGWAGGDRLAIHGTSDPSSIGLAASTGCLRASDRDLRRLMRQVPLGAPVFDQSLTTSAPVASNGSARTSAQPAHSSCERREDGARRVVGAPDEHGRAGAGDRRADRAERAGAADELPSSAGRGARAAAGAAGRRARGRRGPSRRA